MKRESIINTIIIVAMLALLATAAMPIMGFNHPWLRWAFAAAAAVTFVARLAERSTSDDLRVRRLHRMNAVAAVFYCLSAACLFVDDLQAQRSWVPLLLAGAVMQAYATVMLMRLERK